MINVTRKPNDPASPDQAPTEINQIGAFCFRKRGMFLEFLLVTSSHGRWILPKGWPMPGKASHKVALIEAWEEAGVRDGIVTKDPSLTFKSIKRTRKKGTLSTNISVHMIEVTAMASDYPETRKRERRWVTEDTAMDLICDTALREAISPLIAHATKEQVNFAA